MSVRRKPRPALAVKYKCDFCGLRQEIECDIPADMDSDEVVRDHLTSNLGWEAIEADLRCPDCQATGRNVSGTYLRKPSDYARPDRFFNLGTEYEADTMAVSVWVRDRTPLLEAGIADGATCGFELVPESGNPWDSSAVSVDFMGKRVGYFHGKHAIHLHRHLRWLIARGFGLLVLGTVEDPEDFVRIYVEIPDWEDLRNPSPKTFPSLERAGQS